MVSSAFLALRHGAGLTSNGLLWVNFTFISRSASAGAAIEPATFQVQQIWQQVDDQSQDISHLIDRTYRYHSVRELHWHLADRFSRPIRSLALSRV
ncbi:hypothetical protein [Methylobacterium currus]|uniref:hypothetical protein n=1 Tax=Methylobacterium currus TaxID=2051553 RepID=UPI0026957DBC